MRKQRVGIVRLVNHVGLLEIYPRRPPGSAGGETGVGWRSGGRAGQGGGPSEPVRASQLPPRRDGPGADAGKGRCMMTSKERRQIEAAKRALLREMSRRLKCWAITDVAIEQDSGTIQWRSEEDGVEHVGPSGKMRLVVILDCRAKPAVDTDDGVPEHPGLCDDHVPGGP